MSRRVEDLSCNIERVSDDNYVVGFRDGDCLVNTISDSKKLGLSCGYIDGPVTNFIQLISPQPVDRFSQTKLCWKALNEGHPHICGMYKSNNERLRYQAISSCKSFVC